MDDQKLVLMVCLGNICRSPIACAVFNHVVEERGLENKWKCDSAGTGNWHVGSGMDDRSANILNFHYVKHNHVARQIKKQDFAKYDFIFGMDTENISNLKRMAPAGSKAKIALLASYDPKGKEIIRDPYYDTGMSGFEECYQKSLRSVNAFLDKHT